jgi:phasin family protein
MTTKSPFPEFDFKWPKMDQGFWERFTVPGIDSSALMQSQQKNFEALVNANQKAAEGYQALLRRQGEILGETMRSIQEAANELMQANDGRELPKKQAELIEKTIGNALKYMQELAELTITANTDTMNVIQDRARESVAEMRELAEKLSSHRK